MKLRQIILAASLMTVSLVNAQHINEITQAMLGAYDQTLLEDPNDYITLYRRAVEYCRLERYDAAMLDIDKAIKLTSAKESDLLKSEYSLKSDIYIGMGDYNKAIECVDKALTVDPKSFADIYKKGNILLALEKADEAYSTFQQLLRLKSRSTEAMYGMARASVKRGNINEVNQLIAEIKNTDSTSPITYNRIGDIYCEMGDYEKGVVNYITALLMGNGSQRPINSLKGVAIDNYDAFKSGFLYAEEQSKDNASTLCYVRGVLSAQTGHYQDAYDALMSLAAVEPTVGLLTHLSSVCLRLNKLAEAKKYADRAISACNDNHKASEALLVKSAVELAQGNPAAAMLNASKAYSPSSPDSESLMALAKAAVSAGEAKAALDALNEIVLLDADAIDALLLRAYVKKYMNNDLDGAEVDLKRASNVNVSEFPQLAYKALAQTLSGKTLDGQLTITEALKKDNSGEAYIGAAVYYAQTGNAAKSSEYIDLARKAGFEDEYFIEVDKTPYISLSVKK